MVHESMHAGAATINTSNIVTLHLGYRLEKYLWRTYYAPGILPDTVLGSKEVKSGGCEVGGG